LSDLLSSLITGVAAKRLSAVEALPTRSNQHEFNGVHELRSIFGDKRTTFAAQFVYLGISEDDLTWSEGFVTWYDARENHPTRSEFRLYFPTSAASEKLLERDLALIIRRSDGTVLLAFAQEHTTSEQQLLWLFGLASPQRRVLIRDIRKDDRNIGFAAREILGQLGIYQDVEPPSEEAYLEILLDRFGGGFPTTAEFSQFARDVTPEAAPALDPDEAIIMWLEREEALFRQLERHLLLHRMRAGFGDDVDAFVAFSLSVQNRRKSRIGFALENHLEAVFRANNVDYSRGRLTERASRPDFVFPNIKAYQDSTFPTEQLTMLGVKSTCKDRWRQILAEADRMDIKHLFTLEPGISTTQTDEMRARQVRLVIPLPLHNTFAPAQRSELLTLGAFINLLKAREKHSAG
jgi:hypothetical protein